MKIFERFTSDLDSSGETISQELSEVDLSNPEDVKAMIPDHSAEILVHFGEDNFLDRYRRFKEHLPEWRTVYPKLSSVDMRYERQVVLEMQPGSSVPAGSAASATPAPVVDAHAASKAASVAANKVDKTAVKPAAKSSDRSIDKSAAAKAPPVVATKLPATKPATQPVAKAPVHVTAQSEVAFDVPANKSAAKAKPHTAAKHKPVATKPGTSTTQHHSPQVVHP
jgi:cell division protein FtsQ